MTSDSDTPDHAGGSDNHSNSGGSGGTPLSYKASRIFGAIKIQKDLLEGNMTTSQYMNQLDSYLYSALRAIETNTNYLDNVIAGLIGWQEKNFRRRVSLMSKREFIQAAVLWLLKSREERVRDLPSLKLDRGVIASVCQSFLDLTEGYTRAMQNKELTQADLAAVYSAEQKLLIQGGSLHRAVAAVKYRSDQAIEFKGKILSKYSRMSIMAAKRDYTDYFEFRINLDDMCCEYLLAAARAIDKCDYEKGPLTTHIQNWFYTARSHCQKRYDTGLMEKSTDFSETPTEDSTYSLEDSLDTSESELVRRLAKIADPSGIGRRALGIEEYFNLGELRVLGFKNL